MPEKLYATYSVSVWDDPSFPDTTRFRARIVRDGAPKDVGEDLVGIGVGGCPRLAVKKAVEDWRRG